MADIAALMGMIDHYQRWERAVATRALYARLETIRDEADAQLHRHIAETDSVGLARARARYNLAVELLTFAAAQVADLNRQLEEETDEEPRSG